MRLRHVTPFAFGLFSTLVAACAPAPEDVEPHTDESAASVTPPPTFVPTAVNVDQSFSDAVKVQPDALVVPTSQVGKIEIGSIVAGNRSSNGATDADNPYGFLRKVTDIKRSGKTTTLVTERAELSDWILDGKIDFGSKRSLLEQGVTTSDSLSTQTLHVLDDKKDGEKKDDKKEGSGEGKSNVSSTFGPSMAIKNASFTLKAKFDGYFEIEKAGIWPHPPKGAKYKSLLTLDPSVAADIWVGVKGKAALQDKVEFEGVPIALPTPIPVTLRFAAQTSCHISASGEMNMVFGANLGAHVAAGFEGSASLTHFDVDNISEGPSFTGALAKKEFNEKGELSAGCEISAKPELLVFDAIGISGTIGPYIDLTGSVCVAADANGIDGGVTVKADYGFQETINGRIQIPVIGKGKDFKIKQFKQSFMPDGEAKYLVGAKDTCDAPSVDSCAGKSDGLHCSEVNSYAGIVCQGGQILKGIQCQEMTQKCTGGTENAIQCSGGGAGGGGGGSQ